MCRANATHSLYADWCSPKCDSSGAGAASESVSSISLCGRATVAMLQPKLAFWGELRPPKCSAHAGRSAKHLKLQVAQIYQLSSQTEPLEPSSLRLGLAVGCGSPLPGGQTVNCQNSSGATIGGCSCKTVCRKAAG